MQRDGRRKLRDAEDTQSVLAAEGGAFIGALYGEQEKARKSTSPATSSANIGSGRSARSSRASSAGWTPSRQRRRRPEPLAAAIRYHRSHDDALFRFVDDPIVPIDNSPTEREFRNVARHAPQYALRR